MSRSGTPLGLFVCGGPERGAGSFGDSTFFCTRYDHRFVFASEGDRQDSDLDRTSSMTMSADSNQSVAGIEPPPLRPDHHHGLLVGHGYAASRSTRCTVPVPTPNVLAIFNCPIPVLRSSSISASMV